MFLICFLTSLVNKLTNMTLKFGGQVISWKIWFELADDNSQAHIGVSAQLGFTRKLIGSGYLLAQNHTMYIL